jgi:hypothetical protein
MTDIMYTHEPPAEAEPESGYPESTLSLRLDVDGIGLSWTLRGTDESMSQRLPRVLAYLKRLQDRLPKPAPAAVPQPPLEDREDFCPIHQVAMVRQSNERGTWHSHRLQEGGYCKGRRKVAGA